MTQGTVDPTLERYSTVEIAKQAFDEAKELIAVEVQLAKVEALTELKRLRSAAIAGAVAFAFVLLTFSALVTALILALGASAIYALIVAAGLLLVAAAAGAYAYTALPKAPLDQTRERLKDDLQRLREHTA